MTRLRPEKVYIKHADRREVSEFSLYLGMTPYKDLAGVQAPVCVSDDESPVLSKSSNREARQKISRELGHERLDVTNAYLGKHSS